MEGSLVQSLKDNNFRRFKEVLQKCDKELLNKFLTGLDGMSPLQFASYSGSTEMLALLIQNEAVAIDLQDREGNTALHIACAASVHSSVDLLLAAGANVLLVNNFGKRAIDYIADQSIKNRIQQEQERLTSKGTKQFLPNAANSSSVIFDSSFCNQVLQVLPSNVSDLKNLLVEVMADFHTFKEKCREVLFQLIEEKHIAYYKYSLMESAAGIKDKNTGLNFLDQLAYLQQENEKQAAHLNYYKTQNKMMQRQLEEQDEMNQQSMQALMQSHNEELTMILKRNEEMEKIFQSYRTKIAKDLEEFSTLKTENLNLKSKLKEKNSFGVSTSTPGLSLSSTPDGISSREEKLIMSLQNENTVFDQKMKDMVAHKVELAERLKNYEKMKNQASEVSSSLVISKEEAAFKIQEDRRNQDEIDEHAGLIVFIHGEDGSAKIKGGTSEKLIERLIDGTVYDSEYVSAFLLTYRSFISKNVLLEKLVERFNSPIEDNSEQAAANLASLQLRICNTIKQWVSNHFYDFSEDTQLLTSLTSFIEDIKIDNPRLSAIISFTLNQKQKNRESKGDLVTQSKMSIPPPKPILPKALMKRSNYADDRLNSSAKSIKDSKDELASSSSSIKFKFSDIDPMELARQITNLEHKLFVAIRPTEFLDLAWMKEEKEKLAPNICKMTKFSNHIVNWTISEIVTNKESAKSRALIFEKFITIAKNLETLKNFNGLKEILAALSSASVYRLKKSKELIASKYMKIWNELNKVTSSELNFKILRAKINSSEPPVIPFPGVYQGDLVFLDTCSKNFLEGGLINFQKHQKVASYIQELTSYQKSSYNLEVIQEICDYIKNYPVLDEETAYNFSLQCEPRQ